MATSARKAWKWVLGLLGSLILIVGLLGFDVQRRSIAQLERQRAQAERQVSEILGRDHRRPSAYLEPIDGNAWDHYGSAMKAIDAIPMEIADLVPEVNGLMDEETDPPDDHALHNLFREQGAAIAEFELGAKSREERPPGMTFRSDMEFGELNAAIKSSRFLAGAIRHLHRMKRDQDALPIAFSGLCFAQDMGRSGLMIHAMLEDVFTGILAWSLKDLLAEHSLTARELSDFAASLDRLDATASDILDCIPREALHLRFVCLDLEWEKLGRGKASRSNWHCLFSRTIARAEALSLLSELEERVAALRPLPPWNRPEACKGNLLETRPTHNPLFDAMEIRMPVPLRRDASTRLERVLLRVAVGIAWFEAEKGRFPVRLDELVPRYLTAVPLCPITGLPLLTRAGKVWSVGWNRVDDGGAPGPSNSVDDKTGDVVWVVKRRK